MSAACTWIASFLAMTGETGDFQADMPPCPSFPPPRHCERSEAIQAQGRVARTVVSRLYLDCFVPRNDGGDGRFSSGYAALSVISRPVIASAAVLADGEGMVPLQILFI
ncbi:MAG: hypothetical protein LBJ47_10210 [Tannerella sp.]|nr:hypothetical protein [Tannerella sp.]